jgi:hypothetical protein
MPMTATSADVAASIDAEGQAPELELAEEIGLSLWWKLERAAVELFSVKKLSDILGGNFQMMRERCVATKAAFAAEGRSIKRSFITMSTARCWCPAEIALGGPAASAWSGRRANGI